MAEEQQDAKAPANPLNPSEALKRPAPDDHVDEPVIPQPILPHDSATTKAEKVERSGIENGHSPPSKKVKLEASEDTAPVTVSIERVKGFAAIKAEYAL